MLVDHGQVLGKCTAGFSCFDVFAIFQKWSRGTLNLKDFDKGWWTLGTRLVVNTTTLLQAGKNDKITQLCTQIDSLKF